MREQIVALLILINIFSFCVMGIDKRKAIKKGWRTPERTMLLMAFAGCAVGIYLGMQVFRHKIRKKKFTVLVPLFIILQLAVLYLVLR